MDRVTICRVTRTEFQTAFDEHNDAVYRFVWRMTGSDSLAEDIAQDTFLVLLRQPDVFDPRRGTLRQFLLGIARNLTLKRWRDENRWQELEDEHFSVKPFDIEHREIADAVREAVQSLPPLQREVLILAEYEELSLEAIAQAVESEIGTVKARLHRARENLRRMLASFKINNSVRSTSHGTLR